MIGFVGCKTANVGAQLVAQSAAIVFGENAANAFAQVFGISLVKFGIDGLVVVGNVADDVFLASFVGKGITCKP
jgi:hypothetical protein